jgi:outer membrane receptor protein involved in Fe transport
LTAKLALDWRVTPAWQLGMDAQWVGRRTVQGNEDGKLEDDEDDIHRLHLASHATVNLRAAWQARPGLTLMFRIDNAFDRRFESFGALAETVFDAQGRYTGAEQEALFVGPGAPRRFFAGVRWKF